MKIVIAPDSFKGSATSIEIATWIESGIHSVIPECETVKIAIGDGGEGTLDALLSAGFESHEIVVRGPTSETVQAKFGMRYSTALIELAQASGLSQLPGKIFEPLTASSYGTGELIRAALDKGATKIILAVGGSACTDAGAGALQALGARLLDIHNKEIAFGGAALQHCRQIDLSDLDERIPEVEFCLAVDVSNPLLGPDGAAHVYSPQKGASTEEVILLESSLSNFSSLAGNAHINTPGAGAAGGFGYMAMTFLHAYSQSGIDLLLDLLQFSEKLAGADLVITGEGRFDSQSLRGKAPVGILEIATALSIPVALICGQVAFNNSGAMLERFHSISSLESIEPDLQNCITRPGPIIEKIAASIAKSIVS